MPRKKRPSRLRATREKAVRTRVPYTNVPHLGKIRAYVAEVRRMPRETSRAFRFFTLLRELFPDIQADFANLLQGLGKYVRIKDKDLVVRGEIDALYGNLVVEFERDAKRKLSEAQQQLQKYIACLWVSEAPRRVPYLGVATDGMLFHTFHPALNTPDGPIVPENVNLVPAEQFDFSQHRPEEIYYWLDRHLFPQRPPMLPGSDAFFHDFGPTSAPFLFTLSQLRPVWRRLRAGREVILENWQKYLRITYGTIVGDDELFLRHTYLATLAKLMVWARLTRTTTASDTDLGKILRGEFFEERGIGSFLEEDFFSWPAREPALPIALDICRRVLRQLARYDLTQLSEDVLKTLYQELVEERHRHRLGEYYTPDWLAQHMVDRLLQENPRASLLDPACGSGTFLYMAVRAKRRLLGDSRQTCQHILDTVKGIDIHPLAVIIAKTNYLLALGPLLESQTTRPEEVTIPIYLADSIRYLEVERVEEPETQVPGYLVELDHKEVFLPELLVEDPTLYDLAIAAVREFATERHPDQETRLETFERFLVQRHRTLAQNPAVVTALFQLAATLGSLIQQDRDTIWAFVLKNIYKPRLLHLRFDLVVGNPPWLSYRFVDKFKYQETLKRLFEDYGLLPKDKPELVTHLDLATLFFVRTATFYLRPQGQIAFVLPRAVFTADEHDPFRRSAYKADLGLTQVWDLEKVRPLFNVPACVVFARRGQQSPSPLPCETIHSTGNLPGKNCSLQDAEPALEITQTKLFAVRRGKRTFWSETHEKARTAASPYKKLFHQGATIVPRAFWFVEPKVERGLGFDPRRPLVETASDVEQRAKQEYKGVRLEGNIEAEFLYCTLLSTDIVSFGQLTFRLLVLPIRPTIDGYQLLTAAAARADGQLGLARWLDECQRIWAERRGEKAKKARATAWLDYRSKLSAQDPRVRCRVLYTTSATYLPFRVCPRRPARICYHQRHRHPGSRLHRRTHPLLP